MDWTSPPKFSKGDSYELYRKEILAWGEMTDIPKKKQGIVVALSLPGDHKRQIKQNVFDQIPLENLKTDDGLTVLVNFLDRLLRKDDMDDIWKKYEDFEKLKREAGQPLREYISNFEWVYKKIENKGMKLPAEILVFKLIKKAAISVNVRSLIFMQLNFENKSQLYEEAKKALKKYGGIYSEQIRGETSISLRPGFLEGNYKNSLCTSNVFNRGRKTTDDKRLSWKYGVSGSCDNGAWGGKTTEAGSSVSEYRNRKKINPKGLDGHVLRCYSCGSMRHLLDACPDSWENMENTGNVKHKKSMKMMSLNTADLMNQVNNREINNRRGPNKVAESGVTHGELVKLVSEMSSLKEDMRKVKDEMKNESKIQQEKSHSLEMQLEQEKQTSMRLETTVEELQKKIVQIEKSKVSIRQEANLKITESGRDRRKNWFHCKQVEKETTSTDWYRQTGVTFDTELCMQLIMNQLLVLMKSEMLNELRRFNWFIESAAIQIFVWNQWFMVQMKKGCKLT